MISVILSMLIIMFPILVVVCCYFLFQRVLDVEKYVNATALILIDKGIFDKEDVKALNSIYEKK